MEVVEIYSYYLCVRKLPPESGTVMSVTFAANGCVELSPKLPDEGLFGRSVNHMPGFYHFIILNAVYTYAPVVNYFSAC